MALAAGDRTSATFTDMVVSKMVRNQLNSQIFGCLIDVVDSYILDSGCLVALRL
jgi:hypothetical protein